MANKGYQIIVAEGNLGKDPEIKYSESGTAVTKFSLACTTGYGEREHTEWFNVTCFGKTAEAMAQYAQKGTRMLVQGELKTETYEKDGATRYWTQLIADRCYLMGSKPKEEGAEDNDQPLPTRPGAQAAQGPRPPIRANPAPRRVLNQAPPADNSDLPF